MIMFNALCKGMIHAYGVKIGAWTSVIFINIFYKLPIPRHYRLFHIGTHLAFLLINN